MLIVAACAAAPSTQPTDSAKSVPPGLDACRALVRAEPSNWPETMTAVLELGPTAAPALLAALREHDDGSGAEAAVAVLGRLGGVEARELLRDLVGDRGPMAAAAALALGDCGLPLDRTLLLATAEDRLADATLRAASTASLLRLGARDEVRNLVRGILLAGTPYGRELEQALGLPHRPRWAYERHLLQLALRDIAGQDFGLDTDAPWADLSRTATAIDLYLQTSR